MLPTDTTGTFNGSHIGKDGGIVAMIGRGGRGGGMIVPMYPKFAGPTGCKSLLRLIALLLLLRLIVLMLLLLLLVLLLLLLLIGWL